MKTYQRDVHVKVPPHVFGMCSMLEAYRFGQSRSSNSSNTRKLQSGNWLTSHVNAIGSYIAEWAVCKVTNSHWSGLDGDGARDTTAGEVKWSFNPRYGLLLAEMHLDPDEDYWLVIGEPPDVRVVGVMRGADAYAAGRELTSNGRPPALVIRQSNVLGWEEGFK